MGIGGFVCLVLLGFWWSVARPYFLIREARSLLESDPLQACSRLEDAIDCTLVRNHQAELLWCRALLLSGQSDEALGCFSQMQPIEQVDGTALLELADDASAMNIPLLTLMALDAISPQQPARLGAVQRLVGIRKRQGDTNALLKLANEWIQLAPHAPEPWSLLASLHEQRISLAEAAQDYRQWYIRESDIRRQKDCLRGLIRTLIALGEHGEARTRWNELSQLNETPELMDHFFDAQLLRLEGNTEDAWTRIHDVLVADPRFVAGLELRATLAMDRADLTGAADDLRRVLKEQPWNQQCHYKLSQCLTRQGKTEEAKTHLLESRRLLALSNRILELVGREKLTSAENAELVDAFEQTGLFSAAERLRRNPQP